MIWFIIVLYDKFIFIWLTKLLKAYFVCFQLFYRYRSYRKLGDHQGSSPHYQTLFWYLLKMYILKYGMYRLEVFDYVL
ncbi:hypothetical protein F383_25516 [Gossypium arboreum]|uniref:Uncharacterized protein n=1 Tax=Gossypium arboreum TaxID=29729 RepID=A0A0B0P372_GOSAR|nr:hypothetical protein F383_25516 [Gossypium arboreum]